MANSRICLDGGEETPAKRPMANTQMARRIEDNVGPGADGGHTDVNISWREPQSRGRWRTHGCQDGLERTSVQKPAADVKTDWREHQSKVRWRTPGCQDGVNRTPVQRSVTNIRMSGRIGENASPEVMMKIRMSRRFGEIVNPEASGEHTDVKPYGREHQYRGRWRMHG
jgi:hypothetical protein